jgi:hypothetical protein
MSLIIISEPKNKNGKYELTEEKLRDLIQEAYDKGYKDGQAKPKYELQPYTLPGNGGLIKQPNINDPFWYERNPTPWWGEVTCDTVPDVNYVPGVTTTSTQGSDSTSGGFKGNVETTLLNCMKKGDVFPDSTECSCSGNCSCGGAK